MNHRMLYIMEKPNFHYSEIQEYNVQLQYAAKSTIEMQVKQSPLFVI